MSPEPLDPFAGQTPLAEQAGNLHEIYKTQLEVGFSESQSMYLVGCMLSGSPGPAPGEPPED